MPSGYSSKCKTCNSARRLEIEAWHEKDGMSPEAIEVRLKTLGESISYRAISNHFVNHYNVQEEARERYHKSQEQITEDAKTRLTDLQILDELIQDGHTIHKGISEQIKGNPTDVSLPVVQLFNGSAAEICRAIKTKQEILGEDGGSKAAETFLDLMKLASDPDS